ncbi:hypothetical protein [Cohnella sp. GbtcB17]|uniref:hypothetical protein n=1 Tax=Cohnella sp. GbtcB17 TaxID=2824762 RepID=UPI001C30FF4B|nr:hypothetical protein [Cohnella sp. GbtcB17]
MRFEEKRLRIEVHAYDRYCQRVEPIGRAELLEQVQSFIRDGDVRREDDCVRIGDVWWIYWTNDETVTLTTCYGRMLYDLPAALRWQRANKDRIKLIAK